MALVTCPDCGSSVSTAASACPGCGCPMKAGKLNPVHTGQVTTIERTGKGLKGQQVLATLGLLAGVVMLIIAFSDPVRDKRSDAAPAMVWGWVVLVGSILWLLYVRVAMWWRHG